MPFTDSEIEQSVAAIHRGVLGGLLAVVAIFGLGSLRYLRTGELLWGSIGLLLAVGAVYWLLMLFLEGIDEGLNAK